MSIAVSLLSIISLTAVDQIIKFFAERSLSGAQEIVVINNFLSWDYVRNTGAAFGSFSGNTLVLIIITGVLLAVGIIAILSKKITNKFLLTVSVMIISGGIGNLIDRIAKGYVVDYIKVLFIDFPVFNFADILVTCGAFMLIGYLAFDTYRDYKKKNNRE